jgi:hypothetical protein
VPTSYDELRAYRIEADVINYPRNLLLLRNIYLPCKHRPHAASISRGFPLGLARVLLFPHPKVFEAVDTEAGFKDQGIPVGV